MASDFSFTERAIIDVWVWLWFIQRVWSTDKFASLRWSKLCNFDLKSVITLLIFLMLPVQAIFDVIWSYLKYTEVANLNYTDFAKSPLNYTDVAKSPSEWSHEHILFKDITEYILACGFAFQIGTLALMQAFWSHLSSQMGGRPFRRSWKFRFYVGWVFASMVIFPLARFLTSHDIVLSENVPQFIFSLKLFFISLLGIKNGMRLNELLSSIQQQSSPRGQETIVRIHYFIEMNRLLSLGAFLISIGISSITIDAIFKFDHINSSKFWMDFLIIHANFGSLMLWGTMILIVYPRYYLIGLSDIVPTDRLSSEFEQSKIKHSTPSHVVDINETPTFTNRSSSKIAITPITTTSTSTSPTITSDTMTPLMMTPNSMTPPIITNSQQIPGSFSYKVGQSVSNILENQAKQIETYRHKTSTSISSTITPPSPSSPLTPPDTNKPSD